MEPAKEWPEFYPNTTKNFKSGGFDENYGINDVIDVSPKINYSFYDNVTAPEYSNFTTDNFCASNYSHVYLNVTCEFPIEYAEPMYGYIAPFLLATTIVANTLIVVVLSRRHMRTPTNVVLMAMALCDMFTMLFPAPWLFYMYTFGNHYKPLSPVTACQAWNYMNDSSRHMRTPTNVVLMAMALCDIFTMLFPAPWLFYMYTFGNHYKPLSPVTACQAWNYMNDVIPAMFHTASIWLTLALAVQRYIYVCHAPVARTWCTMPRVTKSLIYIGIAAFLHQLPRFFDSQFIPHHTVWRGHFEGVCRRQVAPWVISLSMDAYFISYFGFRVLFVHLIPCTSLVVLNVLLFRAMRAAQLNRQKLFKENRKSECKRLRDSNCTTLMLIVVVTVFLLVEIPVAVVTILHIISSSIVEILDYHIANILILITNFFIIVSYPINFAIYCGMSRQFRETFKELFIRGAVTSRKNGGSSRYSLVNGPRTCTNETVL